MLSPRPEPRPEDPQPGSYNAAGDAEYYCEMLDEVLEIALKFTRLISDEFASLGPDKATIAFDRVTRIIRRSMMLAAKLSETRRKPGPNARTRSEARTRARTEVQAAIDRDPPKSSDPSPERDGDNTAPDRLDSIGTGTIPEIIASLFKDLDSVATTIGKPSQRRLLLSETAHSTPNSGTTAPLLKKPSRARESGLAENTKANNQTNPARYRGSG